MLRYAKTGIADKTEIQSSHLFYVQTLTFHRGLRNTKHNFSMEDSDIEKKKTLYSLSNTKYLIQKSNTSVKRYFVNGEKIEFTGFNRTYSNAKYTINDDAYFEIWFTQICQPLYKGSMSDALCSKLKFKDNQIKMICSLSPEEFWAVIKGRTFLVEVIGQGFGPDLDNQKCLELDTFQNIYQYVHDHLEKNDLEPIEGMLRPRIAYLFIEI